MSCQHSADIYQNLVNKCDDKGFFTAYVSIRIEGYFISTNRSKHDYIYRPVTFQPDPQIWHAGTQYALTKKGKRYKGVNYNIEKPLGIQVDLCKIAADYETVCHGSGYRDAYWIPNFTLPVLCNIKDVVVSGYKPNIDEEDQPGREQSVLTKVVVMPTHFKPIIDQIKASQKKC